MADRRLAAKYFDNSQPLIATRNMTVEGNDVHAGKPLPDGLGKGLRMRLWVTRRVVYEKDYKPTPTLDPVSEIAIVDAGGGWYVITAPWLPDGEKVQGKDKAEARAQELREAGDPKGVNVNGGDGGWFEITADWIADPEKVQGREAADERAEQLRAEGAPEGWTAGDEPLSADALAALREGKAGGEGDQTPAGEPIPTAEEAEALARKAAEEAEDGTADHSALVEMAEEGSNGWYVVSAPWLDEGVKIRGRANAEAEQTRIREEGPPEGWTPTPKE